MTDVRAISHENVRRVLAESARRWAATPAARDEVATLVEVQPRTAKSWFVDRATEPSATLLLRLMAALGPGFTNRLMELAGYRVEVMDLGEEPDMTAILSRTCSFTGALVEALADRRIDHLEAARLEPMVAELREDLSNLLITLQRTKGFGDG